MIPTSTEGMSPEVMELMQSQAADMTETGGGDLMPEIGKRALQIGFIKVLNLAIFIMIKTALLK